MQVSSLSNKSMIAEVPMCLIMRSTKSCFLFKKSTICSGFLLIRILSTLLKKLASKGFRGDSFKRKLYSFISKDSSSPSLSLICETSDVSSSQDMFGYLGKRK